MEKETLDEHQIEAWRKIIYMQLEARMPGAGMYAIIMPKGEIIEYWKKMKKFLETPANIESDNSTIIRKIKPPCDHSNSFTGNKGKYCIDCEKYV
jgi:hypothetical protein